MRESSLEVTSLEGVLFSGVCGADDVDLQRLHVACWSKGRIGDAFRPSCSLLAQGLPSHSVSCSQ